MINPYASRTTGHILQITVPFPKSLRTNGEVSETYRHTVMLACRGVRLPANQEIAVSMHFYGKWKDSKNKVRRRDHINYVCPLIDVICDCIGIDDSLVVHWKDLIKENRPQPPEYVVVTLYPAKMR